MTRTRTPSDAKWLANELAMLAGEIASIDEALSRLRQRRKRLKAIHQALSQVATHFSAPELAQAPGPVRAHSEYGGRGKFRALLAELLQAALPGALNTSTLATAVAERLGVTLSSREELDRFRRNKLGRALRHMEQAALVERLHNPKLAPSLVGVWRWTGGAKPTPTVAELKARAGVADTTRDAD